MSSRCTNSQSHPTSSRSHNCDASQCKLVGSFDPLPLPSLTRRAVLWSRSQRKHPEDSRGILLVVSRLLPQEWQASPMTVVPIIISLPGSCSLHSCSIVDHCLTYAHPHALYPSHCYLSPHTFIYYIETATNCTIASFFVTYSNLLHIKRT